MNELVVLLDSREAGIVTNKNGRLTFTYTDSWRTAESAYPLSLSMPLASKQHSHASIEPFLWGLLPDNYFVLESWGRKFQVSPRNAFALIANVGEDCAGAVQFVRPENLEAALAADMPEPDWLSESQIAARLRTLRADASAGRMPGDAGQFSLAGAQAKTALLSFNGSWGIASGRTPTTHIFKPTSADLPGHAENEHLCLRLSAALGMTTTHSSVHYFEDVPTIVVERYDRLVISEAAVNRQRNAEALRKQAAEFRLTSHEDSKSYVEDIEREAKEEFELANNLARLAETQVFGRIHQEDLCQALRIHPANKYQNEGGPGPRQIIEVLRIYVSSHASARGSAKFQHAANDDLDTFIDALIFNWIIGGTDAHAKNYSLLIGNGGMVRLAPLYDIASILAFPDIDPRKARLAMKIGDEYGLMGVRLSDWRKLAATCRIDEAKLVARIRSMAKELPDRLSDEAKQMTEQGLSHNVISLLADILPKRAALIAAM